ncbi:MAG: thermosome subunit beta [Candidatus Helarchaeota archaeon]
MSLSERPMKLLESEFKRMNKEDALHNNIVAASLMAEVIRTSFGPFGLDKLILDPVGDIIITNDGSTIVKNFDVRHPVARILDNLVRSQDNEAGDGSKTAVILAGEFLKQAFHLLGDKVHPNEIVEGYEIALKWTNELLKRIAIKIDVNKDNILKGIVLTALNSKFQRENEEYLSNLVIKAVKSVMIKTSDGKNRVNIKNIFSLMIRGGSIKDSKLINGMIIDKEVISESMPKRIQNAVIAMIEPSLEHKKVHAFKPKIYLNDVLKIKEYKKEDTLILQKFIEKMKSLGVNVAFFRRDISEKAQRMLANAGILATRFVHRDQFYATQKAVGANLITNLEDYTKEDLGYAEIVEERKVGKKKIIFIEGCKEPKALCLLLRAGIKNVGYELERRIIDAISVVKNAIEELRVLPGGGAVELEIAKELRLRAESVHGKRQFAIKTFADAIEIIPKTLLETAGLNIIDVLASLRAAHMSDDENCKHIGIDLESAKPEDMIKLGIFDCYRSKYHAINAATEVANLILRINDVIDQAEKSAYAPPPKPREDIEED